MLKINKKKQWLILAIFLFTLLVLPASLSISYKTFISGLFQLPLSISSLLIREFKALILFHVNANENSRLEREIAALKEKVIKSQEASLENERLHKLLALKTDLDFPTVIALVIGRDASNWSSSLIIDKGSKDKIKVGMPVISGNGLVGRIQEVARYNSRVALINDPGVSVAAVLQRSRQEGIVSGTLAGGLIMHYLDENSDIQIGDLVLTSNISNVYPKGIIIGKVTSLVKDPNGMMLSALIDPAVKLIAIEEVIVVLKND